MVSAFAARQRLVLGQVAVAEKSNEIVAIPALLDIMAVEGAAVTIDATGCQRNIAKKIIAKKADYIFALKEPIQELVESDASFVIPLRLVDSQGGTQCGSLNIVRPPSVAAFVIRAT